MSATEVMTYTEVVKDLMARKSYYLSKAQAFSDLGMRETAQPLFLSAASLEEQIAALLDTEGRELDAAVHRISAASCYANAAHLSHAVNLYRAALSGPIYDNTRTDILIMLQECLQQLAQKSTRKVTLSPVPETAVLM